jgi:hypothetical protein
VLAICAARRSVGVGELETTEVRSFSSWGLSVTPDAGGGVVAAISRTEGSEGVS